MKPYLALVCMVLILATQAEAGKNKNRHDKFGGGGGGAVIFGSTVFSRRAFIGYYTVCTFLYYDSSLYL